MTIRELLKALAPYTIPDVYIDAIGEDVKADMDDDVELADAKVLNRAKARLYLRLATLPNVSEGGVSISFTATEKQAFFDLAKRYALMGGETGLVPGGNFGYKGQNI